MNLQEGKGGLVQVADKIRSQTIADLKRDIEALESQRIAKEQALKKLQARHRTLFESGEPTVGNPSALTLEQKITLFLELFGARRDVYPRFWENTSTGKTGYSPAYQGDRLASVSSRKYIPLDEHVVDQHLRGNQPIGVYALRTDDSCIFLAADFDGDGWRDDVLSYIDAAKRVGVSAALERSRSGNGAHAWIFFSEPVPAARARKLGTILLAKASAARPTMSLNAYDRLFPNQDIMPKGGFGNLIALPLAGKPRKIGNTVFLDENLHPLPDQWGFLCTIERISREGLETVLGQSCSMTASIPFRDDDITFALESDEDALDLSRPSIREGMISGDVTLRFDSRLHIPRALPSAVLAALKRLAAFANPAFHRKLRQRFSTHDTPRFIFAGEWLPDRLVLPRGTLDGALAILESAGAEVVVQDARPDANRINWTFHGELRSEQKAAVQEMARHDNGVLCAPAGSGKTVMGCALIARNRTATLVLVHRALLLDQWRKEASRFLGIAKRKEIGIWRGATRRLTRKLDIAMLPSLSRIEDYAALFEGYGFVIVDECHHVPAATFEALLKSCSCRKIIGLTATPVRKDGLEKLLYMQCGPIRHSILFATEDAPARMAYVRRSSFHIPDHHGVHPPIHLVWESLVADVGRAKQIVADVRETLDEGRCPLVLSDRRDHLDKLEAELKNQVGNSSIAVYRIEGGIGKKAREAMRAEIDRRFEAKERFVIFATASLIGEGYDLPRLDTLFLAMPLSFKGRLVQYAGRLHRPHPDKREVRVYDYLDEGNPLTVAMFRRRSSAYRLMGYSVIMDNEQPSDQMELR